MEDSMPLLFVFLLFVLISSLTLLNMLIGVLSQVIKATASRQSEHMQVYEATAKLKAVFEIADCNGDHKISRSEFDLMLKDPKSSCVTALISLGIQEEHLHELTRQLFEDEDSGSGCRRAGLNNPGTESQHDATSVTSMRHASVISGLCHKWDEKELTFSEFIDELLSLKSGTFVSVRDMWALRRISSSISRNLTDMVEECSDKLNAPYTSKESRNSSKDSRATNKEIGQPMQGTPPPLQPLMLSDSPQPDPTQAQPQAPSPRAPTPPSPTAPDPPTEPLPWAPDALQGTSSAPVATELPLPTRFSAHVLSASSSKDDPYLPEPESGETGSSSGPGKTIGARSQSCEKRPNSDGPCPNREPPNATLAKNAGVSKLSGVPTDMIVAEMHRRFSLFGALVDAKSVREKKTGAAPAEWSYLVPGSFPSHHEEDLYC